MSKTAKLTLFDFTMIVVSLVIGMGIFRTPLNVAKAVPTTFIFFAAWIMGGLVAYCGALTYAEIGSRLPVTGGYYKVFAYAYHPSIAFAINCVILVSNAASLAGVAIVGGEYITSLFIPEAKDALYRAIPGNAQHIQLIQNTIAISAIVFFYGVNLLGLKMSARTQNVLTVIKISMVILLILPVFFSTHPDVIASPEQLRQYTFIEYIKAFGIALVAVSFSYGGYQQTINFGAEVKNANRMVPRGIFFGICIIITLYLAINYAYIHVIGFEQMKNSTNLATIMASRILGINGERVLSVLIFLGVLAYVNALLLSNPRVMYAMSEDGILPAAFGRRNNKTDVLTVSLSVFTAICVIVVFWAEKFEDILSFSIFLDSFGMALSAGSIFLLRKKTAHLNGSGIYQMKWYPLQPLIFIATYIFIAISLLINETRISLTGLAVLAVFVSIYFLVRASSGKKTSHE